LGAPASNPRSLPLQTVQIISFVAWLKKNIGLNPVLIIGPLSTVGNWAAEFERFAPTIPVVVYRGPREERRALLKSRIPKACYTAAKAGAVAPAPAPAASSPSEASPQPVLPRCPVFVTSFEVARLDEEELEKVPWDVLVVDEGHRCGG
jgi:ATP-dependent DNA helicase